MRSGISVARGGRGWRVGAAVVAAAVGALGLSAEALAQSGRGGGAAGGGRILERVNPKEWTLRATVNVRAYQRTDPQTRMPIKDAWNFDSAAVVFPFAPETASHKTDERRLTGVLRLNDRVADDSPTLIPKVYHSGQRLARWELVDWTGQEAGLEVEMQATSWQTKFDEEAAKRVGWPTEEWPALLKETFEPQMYVDFGPDGEPYDMKPVDDLIKRWTNGNDPKKLPPVTLAKFLAGEVQKAFQPSGNGMAYARTGEIEGINLQGAAETALRRRGSDFDIVTVLAAVYRRAGLPTRIVVGYDVGDDGDFLERKGAREGPRAWVEFALWDGSTLREPVWVPVDVIRMRRASSRPRPLEQTWDYFGTHNELNAVVPFTFHFHPPTSVRAYGSPAFWGWLVMPAPPERADQALRFNAFATPKRGGQPAEQGQEPARRGRGRR